jgi:GT2 family glycosyltransferase
MKKMSLCTVCMNRLTYLAQTLPVNLAENCHIPNVEFLVLDYNSQDNMESWVRDNLSGYIASGKLKYYKTCEPEFFHTAHSKNMIMKLADGDIIGMIDADNFAGPGYAEWALQRFELNGPQTITTTLRKDSIPYRDQGGKICFSRERFHSVKGFDESLIGYGMDDVDLVNRLENAGGKRVFIEAEEHLQFIGHSNWERLKNYRYPNYLEKIYFNLVDHTPDHAHFLYLFKDHGFSEMNYWFKDSLKHNLVVTFMGWTIDRQDGRRDGRYRVENDDLHLDFEDGTTRVYKETKTEADKGLASALSPFEWKELGREEDIFSMAVLAYCECQNRLRYVENDRNDHPVNPDGWGRGTVYCNFNIQEPIRLI